MFDAAPGAGYNTITSIAQSNVQVVVPHLPPGLREDEIVLKQKALLDLFLATAHVNNYILWYYSPLALPYSNHLTGSLTIYDCMDELSAFKFASPRLKACETALLEKADLLLTGGYSLYNAKKIFHKNAYCFPSSIDKNHFSKARQCQTGLHDQDNIPHPRFGFFGVVDERFNAGLLGEIALLRKDWHFIIIGPVVKIDPASLPNYENIHYLGMKQYRELPAYLSGWDVAIMPFALNEATRFISPTKTPEYLAGGKPVISTSIADVIHTYGNKQMVRIADTAREFIQEAEHVLNNKNKEAWLSETDALLADMSWDNTVQTITALIHEGLKERKVFNTITT